MLYNNRLDINVLSERYEKLRSLNGDSVSLEIAGEKLDEARRLDPNSREYLWALSTAGRMIDMAEHQGKI